MFHGRPKAKFFITNLFLGLVCFLLGLLSLEFSIPPGYAAPFWPVAGVALAFVWRFGFNQCLGVFVGTFFIHTIHHGLTLPLLLAAGATIQVVVGRGVIKKFISPELQLVDLAEILKFMTGVFGFCLINAAISVFALVSFGIIPAEQFVFQYVTWWLGESTGVVIFTPLVFCAIGLPRRIWIERRVLLTVSTMIFFSTLAVVSLVVSYLEDQNILNKARIVELQFANVLKSRLREYEDVLYSIRSYYEGSNEVKRSEFKQFVQFALERFPGLKALEWVPEIPHDKKDAFVQSAMDDGLSKFRLTQKNDRGEIVDRKKADLYYPVYFIEPYEGNEKALGFDLSSSELRFNAMKAAWSTGEIAITEPIELIQDTEGSHAFLLFLPVEVVNARGFVLGVFTIEDIFDQVKEVFVEMSLLDYNSIQLWDVGDKEVRFFNSQPNIVDENHVYDTIYERFEIGLRQWELRFQVSKSYIDTQRGSNLWFGIIAGLFFACILEILFLIITGQSAVVRSRVDEETKKLSEAMKLLKDSEERLNLAIHSGAVGIWDWRNVDDDEQWWSEKFYELLGYSVNEILANYRTFVSLIHDEDKNSVVESIQDSIRYHKPFDMEFRLRLKNNSFRWFRGKAVAFSDSDTDIVRLSGAIVDIHEQEMANIELERSNVELEQFAYVASHDLQAPIRKIVGFSQILQSDLKDKMGDREKTYMQFVIDGAMRMHRLILDLLEYSRAGSRDIVLGDVDMNILVDEVKSTLGSVITESEAEIITKDLPRVRAHSTFISQLLQNLIGNAIKYRSDAKPKVEISTQSQGECWEFAVKDNGLGMDIKFADRIFVVFQRLYAENEFTGTGIGLAICRRIVERHGGKIWLEESKKGYGSIFKFTLPK